MILLDEIVEVLPLPQFATVWQGPFRFQFLESFGIGRVFINRNDARCCTEYFPYPLQKRALMLSLSVLIFTICEPETWLEDFLYAFMLPDFGMDMRNSQHNDYYIMNSERPFSQAFCQGMCPSIIGG